MPKPAPDLSAARRGPLARILKNGGWALAAELITRSSGILLAVALTRTLSKEGFGEYNLVISAVGLAAVFALPGMAAPIAQAVARGFDGTFRLASRSAFIWSLAGTVGILAGALYRGFTDGPSAAFPLAIAALLFPAARGLDHWSNVFVGRTDFRSLARWRGLKAFIVTAVAVGTCLLTRDLSWIVAAYFGAQAATNIALTAIMIRTVQADAPAQPEAVSFGVKSSFIGSAANTAGNQIDALLIFAFLSPEVLAVFAAASKLPEILKSLVQSLSTIFIRDLAKLDAITSSIERKMDLICAGTAVVIIILAFTALPIAIPLIYSSAYVEAVPISQVLLLTVAVGLLATVRYTFLKARIDLDAFKKVHLSANFVRIIASCLLIPFLGVWGAVASTLLYRLTTWLATDAALRMYRK